MAKKGKTEKVSVTLPTDLAQKVRELVPQGQVSSFVSEAVAHYIAGRRQMEALKKGFGAWKDEDHPDLMTPEDSTAFVRALRASDRGRQEYLERLWRENGK
ncbi:MAG: hypothetical protein HYX79_08680 [Chloroflexi bacterium]|nr:hypothetical protein [Chloroflexota bacterium]